MVVKVSKILPRLTYSLLLFVLFDVFVFRLLFGFGSSMFDNTVRDFWKVPEPYVSFVSGRVAAALPMNMEYKNEVLWYPEAPDASTLRVLLFGGSTGEFGDPNLAEALQVALAEKKKLKVSVANFSCGGSHHRQHLHMLYEVLPEYKPDIVIFYGGNNETTQYEHDDLPFEPRPGYPFNFYYKSEFPTWKKFLLEYSAVIGVLDNKYGFLSKSYIDKLRKKVDYGSEKWSQELVNNYFESLEFAHNTVGMFDSGYFGKTIFVAYFQPFKHTVNPKLQNYQVDQIRARIPSYKYIYDFHDAYNSLDKSVWADYCHVNGSANKYMADLIADTILRDYWK